MDLSYIICGVCSVYMRNNLPRARQNTYYKIEGEREIEKDSHTSLYIIIIIITISHIQ